MSKKAAILEAHKKHPGAGAAELAKILGDGFTTKYCYEILAGPVGRRTKAKNPKSPTRRTLDAFKMRYDDNVIIPRKIESGIEAHLTDNGEPSWMRDREFREACGVPVSKWRRFADEYKHLQVKVPGDEIVWGHPKIIDEMRKAVQR